MYKKQIIALLVLFLLGVHVVHASPWGVADSYAKESPDYKTVISSNHKEFALYRFLTGRPITYILTFDEYEGQTPQTDDKWQRRVFPVVKNAFDAWPAQTAAMIAAKGRTAEFKDILPALKRPVQLVRSSSNNAADIMIDFKNIKGAAFTYNTEDLSEQKHIRVPSPAFFGKEEEKKLPNFLLHEIGHYYGLGDRYQEGIVGNSPTYSTTGDTDGEAIMASSSGDKLTCDDADGFINLMDLTQFLMQKKWPARASAGWKSLCGNSKMYIEGKEQNRAAFYDGTHIYYYNKDGTVKAKELVRVSSVYNPFATAQAAKGPFKQVHTFTDDEFAMKTHINYMRLGDGKIFGSVHTANLLMSDFTVVRRTPHQWDFLIRYERDASGAKNRIPREQDFTVSLPRPNACQVKSSSYFYGTKNIRADLNPAAGDLVLSAQVEDDGLSLQVRAEGKIGHENYVFSQGNKTCTMRWTDDEIYADDSDTCDEWIFTTSEAVRALHDYLKNAAPMCRYVGAVEEETISSRVAASLRK